MRFAMKPITYLVIFSIYLLTVQCFYDPIKQTYRFDYMASFKQLEEKISTIKVDISKVIPEIISNTDDLYRLVPKISTDYTTSSSSTIIDNIHNIILSINPYVDNIYKAIEEQPYILAPIIQVSLILVFMIGSMNLKLNSSNLINNDQMIYQTGVYDPIDAQIYYSRRPIIVINRFLAIASASAGFGIGLLIDYFNKALVDPAQERLRAEQLTTLLTSLGPTFIKIGQSLSVRTDLLRPAYIQALTQLQDRVPPFPTIEARSFIEKELGRPVDQIFVGLTPSTNVVAAASLGQVYKAQLKNNNGNPTSSFVAVKVQRPDIVKSVSLDMHIIRQIAPILKKVGNLQSDLVGIIDDWGLGFVNELDYAKEAENARIFTEAIAKTPLGKSVFAPTVLTEFSTKKILTTEWVDGERLEKVSKDEVAKLCSLAMNTYLTMMLESPILHADPHPGNLRSTPDGRLCIMDWGLVTSITPDLQLNFIDHISHLVSKDYEEVPEDLVRLGFIPPGKESLATDSGVVMVLADIYGKWAIGGGAAKIDVGSVISQLNNLSERYGNLFQLPPYFAYIARAFGVLEGIGLASDPDYAIVSECLPYIAQRLLKNPDERTNAALAGFIFGKEKANIDTRVIDIDRIELLVNGFSNYQSTAAATLNSISDDNNEIAPFSGEIVTSLATSNINDNNSDKIKSKSKRVQQFEEITDAVFSLLFTDDNNNVDINNEDSSLVLSNSLSTTSSSRRRRMNPMQQLVLEEVVKILGAISRRQWTEIRNRSGQLPSGRSVLGTIVDPFGFFSGSKLISEDENDKRIIESTQEIIKIIRNNPNMNINDSSMNTNNLSINEIRSISVMLGEKIWKKRREVALLSRNLIGTVMRQMSSRI